MPSGLPIDLYIFLVIHLTFLGVPVSWFQVPFPEKPLSDSEEDTKTWRRESSKVKRINSERHSRRCDTELKLAVISQTSYFNFDLQVAI